MNGIQYFTLRLLFLSVAVQNRMIWDLFPSPILGSNLGPTYSCVTLLVAIFALHAGIYI